MNNENLISTELLETLFSSYNASDTFNQIINNMYIFLKENTFENKVIHFELLKFFWERRDYLQMQYNLNFTQIKVLLNQLICNENESNESNQSANLNEIVTEALESSESSRSSESTDTIEVKENEENEENSENQSYFIPYHDPQQFMFFPQPPPQQLNQNLFNILFNNPINNIPIFDIPEPPNQQQQHYQPQNIFNMFTNILTQEFGINNEYITNSGNIINEIFSNNGNISNVQIDNLNNIIPNLGNIYSTIQTNIFNSNYNGQFEINIDINEEFHQNTTNFTNSNNFNNTNVINEKELNKLQIIKYKDLIQKEKYVECAICLDDFNEETKLRLLKCEHGFHIECIDEWLKKYNYNCPICRRNGNQSD
jgi:hypothetical protein